MFDGSVRLKNGLNANVIMRTGLLNYWTGLKALRQAASLAAWRLGPRSNGCSWGTAVVLTLISIPLTVGECG